MAAIQQSLVQDQIADVTECSICTEIFTDPKVLPCVHTFCLHCLEKYGKDKKPGDQMVCPLCRKEFCIPDGGFSHLPNNFFIGKLVEIGKLASTPTSKSLCALCPEDEEVVAQLFCLDCEQNLCTRCEKGCPVGFLAVSTMNSTYCYAIAPPKTDWSGARTSCTKKNPEAQVVTITDAAEHAVISAFLAGQLLFSKVVNAACDTPSGLRVWTSGRRLDHNCSQSFVWSPFNGTDIPMNYTDWDRNQPDCWLGKETCVEMQINAESEFSDRVCTHMYCPMCQIARIA